MSEETLTRRLGDLESKHTELATTIWGDDKTRDNGIRSQVREHETRIDHTQPIAEDAKTKIDDHLAAHAKMKTATTEIKIAIGVALISSAGSILSGIAAIRAISQVVGK